MKNIVVAEYITTSEWELEELGIESNNNIETYFIKWNILNITYKDGRVEKYEPTLCNEEFDFKRPTTIFEDDIEVGKTLNKNEKFKLHLEKIAEEINMLNQENVGDWIENTVMEIQNNNELVITIGGPSIRLYIDSEVLIGQEGFSSDRVFVDCSTNIISEYLSQF